MLSASPITRMQDEATALWHSRPDDPSDAAPDQPHPDRLILLATQNHRANYDLWHQEDEARNPDASHAVIAEVKHNIDCLNQRRNDLTEQIDVLLFAAATDQNAAAPLNSETPGMIIDRLSILALKLYHTAEEAHRETATAAHREHNLSRLHILERQRADLALCLDELWAEIVVGRRRFKLYRQMKMYNDPELNPVLYRGHK